MRKPSGGKLYWNWCGTWAAKATRFKSTKGFKREMLWASPALHETVGPRGLAKCKECSSGLLLDSVTAGVVGWLVTTQSLGDCEDSMRLLMQTVVRQFQKDRRSLGIEPREQWQRSLQFQWISSCSLTVLAASFGL